MKFILLCLAAVSAISTAAKNFEDVEGYTFEEYVYDFEKNYSADEVDARRAIFEANLEQITRHNQGGHSWNIGVNDLSALPRGIRCASQN